MPKLVEWDDYDCGLDYWGRGPWLVIEAPGSPLNGAIGYQRGTRKFHGQELARVIAPMFDDRDDTTMLYDIWAHPSRLQPFEDHGNPNCMVEVGNFNLLWDAVCMRPKGGLIPCILDSGQVVISDRRHPVSLVDENEWWA